MRLGWMSWVLLGFFAAVDSSAAVGPVADRQQGAEVSYELTLGEWRFDPLAGVPAVPADLSTVQEPGADLRLVQFVGPTQSGWLDELRAEGIEVVQYIYPYAYIVWGQSDGLDALAARDFVRWTGDFLPAYRLLPRLRGLGAQVQAFRVLMARAADTDDTARRLAALGAQMYDRSVLNDRFEIIGIDLPGNLLPAVASIPGVYSVQDVPTDGGERGEMSNQVNANNVDQNNLAFPGYLAWLSSVGVSGSGVIIANVDSGVDQNHPDLAGRVLSCSGVSCSGTSSSHGTHTAGIMAATGASGVLDAYGFLRGLGVAPGANLVEQVYSPWYQQPGGMLLLMTDSYNNGASLSGNSWGPAGTPRGYDNDTMQVDIGVRDADPNQPGNQYLSFVLSFMNGYGGTSTQGTPDEAKNIFNVGSTKMQTSSGAQILEIDDLSSNSAHGPALDGRTIPHMVAPGCRVDSTTPSSSYGLLCGTSMASPHVSGAVALFIEYYRTLPEYAVDPSPALIKAAFLPVAHDLAGHLDADGGILGHPFDSKQGWGRLNLPPVVSPDVAVRYFDEPVVFNNTGEEWVQTVSAADPDQPLRIMLVWTDAPGHGLGGSTPAWNNDLDLIVEDGVNIYRGNRFGSNGWSIPGGAADYRNNTEGVFIGPTASGSYTIRVVATNINSDGVPNYGDDTDQDFALVVYNAALEPGFTLTVDPAAQDLCATSAAVVDVNVGQIMGFSTPVALSVENLPPGASAGFSVNPVTPPGQSVLTVSNLQVAGAGEYTLTVRGTADALERTAAVTLRVYDAAPSPPALLTPANGAENTPVRPTFTWAPAPQSATFDLQIATDAAFNNVVVYAAGLTQATFTPENDLAIGTQHYWRVRASNPCGVGAYASAFSFTTRVVPSILLVDDDDNSIDVRSYYVDMLGALSLDFDIWDTNNTDNEPNAADLSPYSIVIWFTGDEFGGYCGPGSAGEAALADFLSHGKNLFISSQDYYYDRGLTAFMTDYLGVLSATSDVSQTTVTGAGVFSGMGPYALTYPFSNWSDRVNPNGSGALAFSGNQGNAAVSKDSPLYRTVFLGFPLEAVSTLADRTAVLQRALEWFYPYVDCNDNGYADHVDIYNGTSTDANGNGIPDECESSPGDMDCDGDVDFDDIDAFVLALSGQAEYEAAYPDCNWLNGDIDGNGSVDFDDIDPFVAMLGG